MASAATPEEPPEEPPTKKISNDFNLCLKCQGEMRINADNQMNYPKRESYQKFIEYTKERAGYGNPDFVLLNQRLHGLSAEMLEQNRAVWHRACYSEVTHRVHTDRDKNRYQKALSAKNSSLLFYNKEGGRPLSTNATVSGDSSFTDTVSRTLTRSLVSSFNRELGFYCQDIKHEKKHARAGLNPEPIHLCTSSNIGRSIQEVVNKSDNELWKLNMTEMLVERDFLSRDIRYHKSCHTMHWQHYVQQSQKPSMQGANADENTVAFISADIEFIAELQDRINRDDIITVTEVAELYTNMMTDHGIHNEQINRKVLLEKVQQNITNVAITDARGRKPAVIHSKEAGRSAIDQAIEERDIRTEMSTIYRCSKIIRQAILRSRKDDPWIFDGSLVGCSETGVPNELVTLTRWILQGAKAATNETRTTQLHNSCLILSHSIVQACKTDRQVTLTPVSSESTFHSMFETPYAVGLSLYTYHHFRSQKAISLLNKCGAGVSYDRVIKICNTIANVISQNIKEYGVYVPPGLLCNRRIRASFDNIDKKVDTPDGKGSFHGTALAVYQRCGQSATVVNPVIINSENLTSEGLQDVPPTVVRMVACRIEGNPKPKTSPHYTRYKIGKYDEIYSRSQTIDIGWMIARFLNRPHICELNSETPLGDEDISEEPTADRLDEKQPIPVWSAYNSVVQTPLNVDAPAVGDQAFGLPIINAPAHEWSTLVTALDQLSRVNELVSGPETKLVASMDMDLYKRALKLEYLDPQYKNKWVLCPGAFHTVLCALRCLGKTIEGSGLDEAWQEADMYSSVTVSQIINGNHYNRALQAHQITLQALFDLWFTAFLEEHPAVCDSIKSAAEDFADACRKNQDIPTTHQTFLAKLDSLNIEKQLHQFDAAHDKDPMHKWTRMYMNQVMVLLQFQRATREGNWFLYLAALEKLCVYFFAYNRLDYAQNIPEYIARMHELQSSDPYIWQEFVDGDFTVNTNAGIPFTRIGVDQAMEHLNKNTKGQGGISGITSYPKTLLKYCLTAPELARLATEMEHLSTVPNKTVGQQHHCLSQAKVRRQEYAIAQLKRVLVKCNIFHVSSSESDSQSDSMTSDMYKLLSKEILPANVRDSILSTVQVGQAAYLRFIEERLTGNDNLWAKMTKVKLLSWSTSAKEIKLKVGSEVMTMKAATSLFARTLVIARSSRDDIDLEEVIGTHEFAYTNRVLMEPDGSIHHTTDKSTVIHLLEEMVKVDGEIFQETIHITENDSYCLIVDGMAVLQELMAVKNFKNCKDLGTSYVQLIDSKSLGYYQVRVIFDNYTKANSLKEGTRERRRGKSKGIRSYKVEHSTVIRDKNTFLSSNSTKDSLTMYLAQQLIDGSTLNNLVTVTCRGVMTNSNCSVMTGVSTQEEADTLMIMHAVEVAKTGLRIHIYSQDTDVLLLALRRVQQLGTEPAIIMGTKERRRKVHLQPIYDKLGPDKAAALINWHALTGCDTTGHIQGKGKKGCFTAFLASSSTVIAALNGLGEGPEPSDEVVKGCEEFLCSLFCPKRLHITQANNLRWHLFKQLKTDQGVDKLPPTHGAWLEHTRRAHAQANVWLQDLVQDPVIVDPLQLGWQQVDGRLLPVLSKQAPAPEAVLQLIRCNCASPNNTCSNRCSCRNHNLACTELCRCGGDDEICRNTQSTADGQDEEDEEDD